MTNGSHNVNVTNGNRNVAVSDRVENDFYATPPEAVEALLKHVKFTRTILEPHVGAGHIAKVLKANGYDVVGTDIVDRGYPHTNIKDFFSFTRVRGDIVMNPPYDNAKEHVEHALDVICHGGIVCALLKIQFLETKKRLELFRKYPPKKILVFSKRIYCAPNGDFSKTKSSALCYAWFIWEKGYEGQTILDWID